MKKIFNIFLISIALVTANSCGNEWLELESSTKIESDGSLSSLMQFEFALNGIYSLMQDSDSYSGRMVYYGDVTGDDIQAKSSTKRTGNYYLLNWVAGNAPSSFWVKSYELIRNCNIVINEIDAIVTATDEEVVYKSDLKGQALAIRALAMFDLTRIYGQPYTMNNGSALGACIVETATGIDSKPSRSTVAQCYDAIIKDLTSAIALLDSSDGEDFNKGKINRWAAMGLLSRVYLYKDDNAKALEMAEEAIDGAEGEKFRLWTHNEYGTIWAADISRDDPGEILFEIVNTTTDGGGKESMGYLCNEDGYDDMILTSSFYALLNEDKDDCRRDAYDLYKTDEAYINKYQPQAVEGDSWGDANIPLIRLSELYLNAAEAAFKLGNNAKAVEYLDPIVNRANPEKNVVGPVTLDMVLKERRKELYGEGHRMYDLLRNNLRVERIDIPNEDEIEDTEHLSLSSAAQSFDRTYHKTILPIPKFEMDANENIRDQQNPGY